MAEKQFLQPGKPERAVADRKKTRKTIQKTKKTWNERI